MRLGLSLIAMIALLPAPAIAADERRLSAAEVERILDAAALKREAPTAKPVASTPAPTRAMESEVGVSIGSGGYREVFGTTIVPLGNEATAIISIGSEENSRRKRRR